MEQPLDMKTPKTYSSNNDPLMNEILLTAESVVSFYEERLDSLLTENSLLERENARLLCLLRDLSDRHPRNPGQRIPKQ